MKLTALNFLILVSASCLVSCASIFNSKSTAIDIYTSKPSRLLINKDTLEKSAIHRNVVVERKKESLSLVVETDSNTRKEFHIQYIDSFAFNMNGGLFFLGSWPGILAGVLIDKKKAKRYDYPNSIYLDIDKGIYIKGLPKHSKLNDNPLNIIKLTPFKVVDFLNPSIELSYERRTSGHLSSQFMLSTLLPYNTYDQEEKLRGFGYRLAFEERYYIRNLAPAGVYYAVELDYLKKRLF